jgi:hypothetical protein
MSNNNSNYNNYDLQHHHMAKKYANAYIENFLQYKSRGEMSTDIRSNLIGYYNLHDQDRMIKNVIRNIALDPRVERIEYEGEGLDYVHVKVKDQYRSKDIPNYY